MSNDIPMSETVIYVSDEQSTNRGFKRLLAIGDFHCGHEVGLTPPQWNPVLGPDDRDHAYRETLYNYFSRFVDLLRPIDIVVANGDLIDGRGEKSGGTELLTPNRLHQINMAADILQGINAPSLYITRGTDYHVGNYESFENIIADKLPVQRIGDVINLRVNKTLFNFRHHIGGSQTPVGTATALTREMAWNDLWAAREGFPDADVVVRSHVHRALAVRDPSYLIMTLPGLQGYGTRYGERRLSGIIHFGVTWFDVYDDGYVWDWKRFPFPTPATSEE